MCVSPPRFFLQVTQYVAEYWNTISNAILCVGALCGLYQVRKHKLETRFEYYILFYIFYIYISYFYREPLSTVHFHIFQDSHLLLVSAPDRRRIDPFPRDAKIRDAIAGRAAHDMGDRFVHLRAVAGEEDDEMSGFCWWIES